MESRSYKDWSNVDFARPRYSDEKEKIEFTTLV